MINTQTLVNFPVFGDNATKAQPDNAKYAAGFQPADVYPAEWVNWVWNKSSGGVTALNEGVNMMEREINNVLDGASKTPDATKDNQLLEAIQKLIADAKAQAILAAHPIGSLYWSSQNTDPGTLFGGTWQRIKDKFILAAGDTYTNGATGGAATVTLVTNNLPSHNHTIGGNTGNKQPTFTGTETLSSTVNDHRHEMEHYHSLNSHTHGYAHTHKYTHTHNTDISHTHQYDIGRATATGGTGSAYRFESGSYQLTDTNSNSNVFTLTTKSGGSNSKATSSQSANTTTNQSATTTDGPSVTNTGTFTGNTAYAGAHSHHVTATGTVSSHNHSLPANTGDTGSGTAVNKMPPYLVKYCWERVS